ncbi:Periostin [Corynascus novoguineensis]|uniref:Periostin n=1 Tax=Corynascus novoguineensis TaxID=1126955 RepID=A0AAN7CKL5_9PEZI|nr:Periostin [Corynascus novoguineensis]
MRSDDFIALISLGAAYASAQSLLTVLEDNGFSGYAELLQGHPILSAGPGLIVYAPTNEALRNAGDSLSINARQIPNNDASNSFGCVRETAPTFVDPAEFPEGEDGDAADTPPGAVRETMLDGSEFVNLGPGHNQSLVERNTSSSGRPTVYGGLGQSVEVAGEDIPFDNGVVRPINGVLTLPSTLSSTLPLMNASAFGRSLQRAGLTPELDRRPSITVLAPNDAAWNEAVNETGDQVTRPAGNSTNDRLAQLCKEHIIVDFPGYTPLLKNGGIYQTLGGTNVTISVQDDVVTIGGARIIRNDAIIINGVVHAVDKVRGYFQYP